jgi:hypothetical protein
MGAYATASAEIEASERGSEGCAERIAKPRAIWRGQAEKGGWYRDMPRGRKRAGWKREFLDALSDAAKDIGEISKEEIQRTIRSYREKRRMPELTVAAEV